VSVLVIQAASTSTHTNSGGWIVFIGVHDSSIESMTIDGADVTGSGNPVVFAPPNVNALPNDMTITGAYKIGERLLQTATSSSATIIFKDNADASSGTHVVLRNITGTFTTGSAAVGDLSGISATPGNSATIANQTTYRCAIRDCEVIGRAFKNQYLIYMRLCFDIDVTDNLVDGRSIIESGSTEFAFDSATVDQNGIETSGCYNVNIVRNTVRNVADSGILLAQANGGIGINNENLLVDGNIIEACSSGIYINSCFNTPVTLKSKNVVVTHNKVVRPWRYGLRIGHTNTVAGEVASGLVIDANTFDLRGSKTVTNTYAAYAGYLAGPANIEIYNGCKLVNNFFYGGGGKGASTTLAGGFYMFKVNNWDVQGNTWDSCSNTNTTATVLVQNCNDINFQSNTISNSGKQSLQVSNSLRFNCEGNYFYKNGVDFSAYGTYWYQDCTGARIVNNTFNATANANEQIVGNANTSTDVEIGGNKAIGATVLMSVAAGPPYVAETGTTQTHNFGAYSPANGGASFTITNGKIRDTSRIAIRQTAGTAYAFTVSAASGSFVLTPSAVFAGTSTYQWQIIN
jgi:hypothetical protein